MVLPKLLNPEQNLLKQYTTINAYEAIIIRTKRYNKIIT